MSRLQAATYAYPPGSIVTAQMQADQRWLTLQSQLDQCRRAFFQSPSPRLGQALKQLEASIKWEKSWRNKKGFS